MGRILRDLDKEGWTERLGYRGRILTAKGKGASGSLGRKGKGPYLVVNFSRLSGRKGRANLWRFWWPGGPLNGRRPAWRHYTPQEEVAAMGKILAKQRELLAAGQSTADTDVEFHRLVALAAKNKVLRAAVDLIRQDGQLTPIMEYIRRRVEVPW